MHRRIPFYFQSRSAEHGSSVSLTPETGSTIVPGDSISISFPRPIDVKTIENGLSVFPPSSFDMDIQEEGRLLKIIPEPSWKSHQDLKIQSGANLSYSDGIPVPHFESTLRVDDNRPPAAISEFGTAKNLPGSSFPDKRSGSNELEQNRAIMIFFSRRMDDASVESAFRIYPPVLGDFFWFDKGKTLVFSPGETYIPKTTYQVTVGHSAFDYEGIPLNETFTKNFHSSDKPLEILSITYGNEKEILPPFHSGDIRMVDVDIPPNELIIKIEFSIPIIIESEKAHVQRLISFRPIFPPGTSEPEKSGSFWTGNSIIYTRYEGLKPSEDGQRFLYRLNIPGGRGGLQSDSQTFLQEDCNVVFETK
ncbi:MAG: Ig-like domain-containing protein [Spirochaetales bacterium]|nr:Ig-like domain-containing protein [Spirochaetales bacterium]MCF7937452.1 Ig-like domain-containing protein [Spirochaetales bacterium]